MKEHEELLHDLDYVPAYEDISVELPEGQVTEVVLHDGSKLRIKKLDRDYDPRSKFAALSALDDAERRGEVLTGVLYVDTAKPHFIDLLGMADEPLATLPQAKTRPSREALDQIMEEQR
jgi:2-oxoglutarate ferredoxin oxidoreductase subunit beta